MLMFQCSWIRINYFKTPTNTLPTHPALLISDEILSRIYGDPQIAVPPQIPPDQYNNKYSRNQFEYLSIHQQSFISNKMTEAEKKAETHEQHSSSDEEHEHVHGENCNHDHEHGQEGGDQKGNRGEKKFKKAMGKMGLKQVTGINRVTIKKGKAFVISIDDPDVWKSPGAESAYVIFGKPNLDGMGAGQNEVNQFTNPVNPEGLNPAAKTEVKAEQPKAEKVENLDETGLTQENINMVMEYGNCSRADAIRALRETNNDSVNAIMFLDQKTTTQ